MEEARNSNPKDPPLLRWLQINPESRSGVHAAVLASADMSRLNYWLEILFSAGIATFGLVLNSPAVIIGAMLISPLMGPIMATGLSLAIGDLYLGGRAILNLVASIAVSVAFSGFWVWLLPFHSATTEIIARTKPNLLDLGIALFSGLAGSVAVSKSGGSGGGGSTSLPGVAIAVALMPPLCTIGFGLGSGRNAAIMEGAGLLFLANLVAIVASAFTVFLLVGMSAAAAEGVAPEQQRGNRLARIFPQSSLARQFTGGAHLRWRILMILIVLGSIAVPLRTALLQVAGDTFAQGVVQTELKRLVPSDAIVSQQVRIDSDNIAIRLISTQPIAHPVAGQVRQAIERRTGRTVELTMDEVASKSELAELLDKIKTPLVTTPKADPTLEETQKALSEKIRAAVEEVWPSTAAPFDRVSLDMDTKAMVLNVRYTAATDLGPIAQEIILKNLKSKFNTPDLKLNLERISPVAKKRLKLDHF